MKQALSATLLFFFAMAHSQENDHASRYDFQRYFTADTSGNLQKTLKSATDSLDRLIFEKGAARYGIDKNCSWELIAYTGYDWKEVLGQEYTIGQPVKAPIVDFKKSDTTVIEITEPGIVEFSELFKDPGGGYRANRKQHPRRTTTVFTGKELYDFLVMNYQYSEIADAGFLQSFPVIYERNDPMNGRLMPVLSGDLLVLRHVHSYPNGNMTSWYREQLYYFRKR